MENFKIGLLIMLPGICLLVGGLVGLAYWEENPSAYFGISPLTEAFAVAIPISGSILLLIGFCIFAFFEIRYQDKISREDWN